MFKIIKDFYRFISPSWQNLYLDYKVNLKPRYGYELQPHKTLLDIINSNRMLYIEILNEALEFKRVFHSIKKYREEKNPFYPSYNNGFLPGLDIIGLYTLISKFKPQTYFEVGSGNSTKVAHKAIKENNLTTKIISVDPSPRAEIDQMADVIVRKPFESISLETIFSLKKNDILFIDNSHRILPNSDCMVFFMDVLPKLPKGVLVHLHDIYLPYDYPQFMCDRFYSEQYGLAFYLIANCDRYQTILPNYFISEDKELSLILNPIWQHPNLKDVERHGGSFWLRIQ